MFFIFGINFNRTEAQTNDYFMPGSSFSENLLYLFCGLGILQGVLLAGLIYFHKKSDKSVNIFLALYILATSSVMTLPFVIELVGWQNSLFSQPIPLLPGPLLYLYLRSFKEQVTWKKAWPHFLLFFLILVPSYFNIAEMTAKYPDAKNIPAEALKRPATILLAYVKPIQQLIYFFLARNVLLNYQKSIKQIFSETSRFDLNWAKFLIYGYLVLVCSFVVIFPLMLRYPEHFNTLLLINMALGTPYIYIAAFKGFQQPTIWQVLPNKTKKEVQKEINETEIIETLKTTEEQALLKTQANSDTKATETANKIVALLEVEKMYQEPALTIKNLADKIQVPTYQVSQAINDVLCKNFYDLINSYRVEEAKRLLLHPDNRNYTILSVGFEAGFNSKTTFNTVFKKFTGLTPTEYRDKQKQYAY